MATITSRQRERIAPRKVFDHMVRDATARVYAFKPYRCGYCGETFLTEAEHDEHRTCPHWIEDQPVAPEGGSNPIEAARMSRGDR